MNYKSIYDNIVMAIWGESTPSASSEALIKGYAGTDPANAHLYINGLIYKIHQDIQDKNNLWLMFDERIITLPAHSTYYPAQEGLREVISLCPFTKGEKVYTGNIPVDPANPAKRYQTITFTDFVPEPGMEVWGVEGVPDKIISLNNGIAVLEVGVLSGDFAVTLPSSVGSPLRPYAEGGVYRSGFGQGYDLYDGMFHIYPESDEERSFLVASYTKNPMSITEYEDALQKEGSDAIIWGVVERMSLILNDMDMAMKARELYERDILKLLRISNRLKYSRLVRG